jgi:hypothetical protein
VIGADAVIAVRRRLGQHCLDQAAWEAGLRRRPGMLPVPGDDLPGSLTYLLLVDPQLFHRACGRALVGQAEQEVAGTPVMATVAPGLPEGDGDRGAGRAGEREEPGGPGVDAGGVPACRADGG